MKKLDALIFVFTTISFVGCILIHQYVLHNLEIRVTAIEIRVTAIERTLEE